MHDLLNQFAELSPWTILAIGLVLIVCDALITADNVLIWVGVALVFVALLDAIGAPAWAQAAAFPIASAALLMVGRSRERASEIARRARFDVDALVGREGRMLDLKAGCPCEGRAVVDGAGEWRVRDEAGAPLAPNRTLVVTGRRELVLLVRDAEASRA